MKRNNNEKIVTFGVKMPATAAAAFQQFCEQRGMTPYVYLTQCVQTTLTMQNTHAWNDEKLREVLAAWDDYEQWQTAGFGASIKRPIPNCSPSVRG